MNQEKRKAGKEFTASDVPSSSCFRAFLIPSHSCVKGGDGMSREQVRKLTSLSSCAG
jgi:hypothetical protein